MAKLKPNQFTLSGHLLTERPILFQTEMVQANLEDRKTHTRRTKGLDKFPEFEWANIHRVNGVDIKAAIATNTPDLHLLRSPYGKPGDLLWVRETWAKVLDTDSNPFYAYKADFPFSVDRWKPSIHMPKEAARLWMMVEDIRVERVQDISEEDAIAEGVSSSFPMRDMKYAAGSNFIFPKPFQEHQMSFLVLWCKINGAESWDANPWVWVVQYRILSKTGRPEEKTILHHFLNIVKGEKNYMTI